MGDDSLDLELARFVRARASADHAASQAQDIIRVLPSQDSGVGVLSVTRRPAGESVVRDREGRDVTVEWAATVASRLVPDSDPWKATACRAMLVLVEAFEYSVKYGLPHRDRAPLAAFARIWRDHPEYREDWNL